MIGQWWSLGIVEEHLQVEAPVSRPAAQYIFIHTRYVCIKADNCKTGQRHQIYYLFLTKNGERELLIQYFLSTTELCHCPKTSASESIFWFYRGLTFEQINNSKQFYFKIRKPN